MEVAQSVVWVQNKHSNTGRASAGACTADIFRGKDTPSDPGGVLVQAQAGKAELDAYVANKGWVMHQCPLANELGLDIEVGINALLYVFEPNIMMAYSGLRFRLSPAAYSLLLSLQSQEHALRLSGCIPSLLRNGAALLKHHLPPPPPPPQHTHTHTHHRNRYMQRQ